MKTHRRQDSDEITLSPLVVERSVNRDLSLPTGVSCEQKRERLFSTREAPFRAYSSSGKRTRGIKIAARRNVLGIKKSDRATMAVPTEAISSI
ncbi:hypothetical protein PUN28_017381 [Cardiocondyla obscurior]|uniref:Uncharacterized protein n=1 Tax=Cardiocondyla obscurior TaxID=286306 RepID=A0AAW2ESD5_9HYME